jgi:hypothetical protein
MADLYSKQAALAGNSTFRARVELAVFDTMVAVEGEAQAAMGNIKWQKRQQYALAVLTNPAIYLDRWVKAVAEDATVGAAINNPVSITSSTNANPTVLTVPSGHGIVAGDTVDVVGHAVNTNANGGWIVSATTATTITLPTAGNGAGTATGTVTKQPTDIQINSAITARIDKFAGVQATD